MLLLFCFCCCCFGVLGLFCFCLFVCLLLFFLFFLCVFFCFFWGVVVIVYTEDFENKTILTQKKISALAMWYAMTQFRGGGGRWLGMR